MPGPKLDLSWGPGHGPVSGVVNAAGWAYGLTCAAAAADRWVTDVHPAWALLAGTGTALAAALAGAAQTTRVVAYRAACWGGAGLWSAWSLMDGHTPWDLPALAAIGVGSTVALGAGLRLAWGAEDDATVQAEADLADQLAGARTEEERIAAREQPILRRITGREVTVRNVQIWESGAGHTLDVDLPDDGTTVADLRRHEDALAAALNLPPACRIEVLASPEGRRQAWIRMPTRDVMAGEQHLPADYSPETIENDLAMGFHADATLFEIPVRSKCVVLVGQTEGGKSNQVNVATCGLVRCTDALVWAIDVTGNGRFPRPWITAWHEGRAPKPAIDWVAPTVEETRLMCQAALNVINDRTGTYRERMRRENADKIMPAPDLPQIVIVADELGALPADVKEMLTQISDTGRGAAVRTISCALEAKHPYVTQSLIAQAYVRVALRVTDEKQIQYLMDSTWKSGRVRPEDLVHAGQGVYRIGSGPMEMFKGWRMEPDRIDAASIAVAPLRPDLDEASAAVADAVTVEGQDRDKYGARLSKTITGVYTNRWERTLPIIFSAHTNRPAPAAPPAAPPGDKAAPGAVAVADPLTDVANSLANLADVAERMRNTPPVRDTPTDAALAEIAARWDDKLDPRQRMRQLVYDARDDGGIGAKLVADRLQAEGYPTTRPTASEWMQADLADGILAQPRGERTPYLPGPAMGDPYA